MAMATKDSELATKFLLIRHAAHDGIDTYLPGRLPGILLGRAGQSQAVQLARRMMRENLAAVHSSPRERALQTADIVAHASGVEPQVYPEIDEIDFGDWSGKAFNELDGDSAWNYWNSERDKASTPAGESMHDVQRRIVGHIWKACREYHGQTVAIVSHADPIKAALADILGISIAALQRFQIAPASISSIMVGDWGAQVLSMNEVIISNGGVRETKRPFHRTRFLVTL
jgi:broad specificity phosphatase PhoE